MTNDKPSDANNHIILPKDSEYEDLAIKWWNWLLSIPKIDNPAYDEKGGKAGLKQDFRVWFIAGSFGKQKKPITRDLIAANITIPPRKDLFFPIITKLTSYGEYPKLKDESELRTTAADAIDQVSIRDVVVNDISLLDSRVFRIATSKFKAVYGKGNVYDIDPEVYDAVADGYWVRLRLPSADYKIHIVANASFIGFQPEEESTFDIDVRYRLRIGK